jgi:hypothetical protein
MRLILVLLILLTPQFALAQQDDFTGQAFLSRCSLYVEMVNNENAFVKSADVEEWTKVTSCAHFVTGVLTGFNVATTTYNLENQKTFCLPDTVKVEQAIRVFVKYLESNPNLLHFSASLLLVDSMTEAFPPPCRDQAL